MRKFILNGLIGWGAGAMWDILGGARSSNFPYNKNIFAIRIILFPGLLGDGFLERFPGKIRESGLE